jgi:hypothetical protein
MKSPTLCLIAALASCGAVFGFKESKSFDGVIMDRQCAQMGSHDNMMKAEGASNDKDCSLACVKNGDKFALWDPTANAVYLIDDDKKVRSFAGQRVHITGSYDESSKTLEIKTVTASK